MAGYIGANTSSVTNNQNAAERRKKFTFTANTTALTGLSFLPNKIHIFHNGIRLVRNTDYTEASDGQSVTLTNAAQAGDEIVAVTFDQNPATGGGSSYTDADVDAHLLTAGVTLDATNDKLSIGTGATLDVSAGALVTPAGHVIQVVQATFDTKTDINSSGSYSNTHITTNITPSSTSNKVLVLINTVASVDAGTTTFRRLKVGRNGTVVSTEKILRSSYADTSGSDVEDLTIHYLDSPSSTSSLTYSLMADANGVGMAVGGRMSNTTANQISSITLMEIAQ